MRGRGEGYECEACGRHLGSIWAFERHRFKRTGRCKTDAALRRLGLSLDPIGVWRRPGPHQETRPLPGIRVRGTRPEPKRPPARRREPQGPSDAPESVQAVLPLGVAA